VRVEVVLDEEDSRSMGDICERASGMTSKSPRVSVMVSQFSVGRRDQRSCRGIEDNFDEK